MRFYSTTQLYNCPWCNIYPCKIDFVFPTTSSWIYSRHTIISREFFGIAALKFSVLHYVVDRRFLIDPSSQINVCSWTGSILIFSQPVAGLSTLCFKCTRLSWLERGHWMCVLFYISVVTWLWSDCDLLQLIRFDCQLNSCPRVPTDAILFDTVHSIIVHGVILVRFYFSRQLWIHGTLSSEVLCYCCFGFSVLCRGR